MSKKQSPAADEEAIVATAKMIVGMTARAPVQVQIGASAVVLSSLIISALQAHARMPMLDKLVKEMRHQIKQAEIKERKASK